MCIHLQIYEIIFVSFCVFLLENFYVFWMFLLFSKFAMIFVRIFPHFYNQIKYKAGNRFYPPKKNSKPMEICQTKQT